MGRSMGTINPMLIVLKVLMILICAGWVCLWVLKPTELWTKSWKKAEDDAKDTVFGYYGLDFAVYSFPVIALAMVGFIYLHLQTKEQRGSRMRISISNLSNPIIVRSPVGTISSIELLTAVLFTSFLIWTVYAHVSTDFKNMVPIKSLKLNIWQYKFMRIGTRFGLLAEACLALLLLPVVRGMTLFRLIGLQFEASIRYHVCLGTAMIFFAMLHGSMTLFIWGLKHELQDKIWLWQKTGRVYLAGEIALVTGLIIWITSLPQIRRRQFEIFYYTHHLYAVFLFFFLFHVGDRHFYMVLSGVILFALDKLLRIIQSRPGTCVLSARMFPCKAMELVLPKHPKLKYTPTSIVFLKVPSISKFEWHPFSITSSSNVGDDKLTIIVKGDGWWTNSLYDTILGAVDSKMHQMKCLPVAVEGPYGPPSMDFLRYDSLLLVAGGIGITPFLSILQDISSIQSVNNNGLPTRIQLIFTTKKSQDVNLLNPISTILLNHSSNRFSLKVKIFVTQEVRPVKTLTELLKDLSEVHTIDFDTKCSNYALHGVESLPWMAAVAGLCSVIFLLALICLNHAFVHPESKASDKKNPSWIANLILVCAFFIATTSSTFIISVIRWRKMKDQTLPPVYQNPSKDIEMSYSDEKCTIEEHEIQYGERPNCEDVFSKFTTETGGTDIGVLVCGPESMKESVALLCRQNSQGFAMCDKRRPNFSFHSLNFAL